jgi:hypothetical protein
MRGLGANGMVRECKTHSRLRSTRASGATTASPGAIDMLRVDHARKGQAVRQSVASWVIVGCHYRFLRVKRCAHPNHRMKHGFVLRLFRIASPKCWWERSGHDFGERLLHVAVDEWWRE